jgi:hypothetical protein
MRIIFVVALLAAGCKDKAKVETAPPTPQQQAVNPYKNVMPAKVKADVEKIQQQHEDKMDNAIEKMKNE